MVSTITVGSRRTEAESGTHRSWVARQIFAPQLRAVVMEFKRETRRQALAALLLAAAAVRPAVGASLHVAVALRTAVGATSPTVFTRVVEDEASCGSSPNEIPMCASRGFVCRMELGHEMFAVAPSCLPYVPDEMVDDPFASEAAAVAPWGFCDPQVAAAPVCQRQFSCECAAADAACQCVPPDMVPDAKRQPSGQDGALQCGDSAGDCDEGQYCKYAVEGGVQCGKKPYYS